VQDLEDQPEAEQRLRPRSRRASLLPAGQRLPEEPLLRVDVAGGDGRAAHQAGDVLVMRQHAQQVQGSRAGYQVRSARCLGLRCLQLLPGHAEVAGPEARLSQRVGTGGEQVPDIIVTLRHDPMVVPRAPGPLAACG